MKADSKPPVATLLTTEQITAVNEDEEVYILKVPNTLSSSSILSLSLSTFGSVCTPTSLLIPLSPPARVSKASDQVDSGKVSQGPKAKLTLSRVR